MRVLVRAASEGSLSAAGRSLGMSAAMATKHINTLEARLGVRLFHRTTRHLSLTDKGRDHLKACQRILFDIDEAEAAAMSQKVEVSGRLRMSVPLYFGVRYIAPLMPAFSRRYHSTAVELGFSDRETDPMRKECDLSIRAGAIMGAHSDIRKLADSSMVVCASPLYLARYGRPSTVAELSRHNCLAYSLALLSSQEWAFGQDGGTRIRISGNLCANNVEALTAAAVGGQGIIYQPDFIVADALGAGKLQVLQLDEPVAATGGIYAVYPPERQPPAIVRAMVEYLAQAYAFPTPWAVVQGVQE
ncbi:LysR family transcriptional regulator [Pollutimonas sp. H1-120]|uniref:LysR family transcriptional regulator n=1 Tax=Pollutimonas sp. H1-120 TaxID=3148824 RepID=UPI003B523543